MIDASNLEQRQGGWSAGSCAILIGTALIVSSVVIRLMTAAIEMPWFDVDPTSIDHPAIGLLPSARFGFDILMLIGAGLILGGQFVRGPCSEMIVSVSCKFSMRACDMLRMSVC